MHLSNFATLETFFHGKAEWIPPPQPAMLDPEGKGKSWACTVQEWCSLGHQRRASRRLQRGASKRIS